MAVHSKGAMGKSKSKMRPGTGDMDAQWEREGLVRGVGGIELRTSSSVSQYERERERERQDRRKHAILLRDLLVSINSAYKARFGVPPNPDGGASVGVGAGVDVEMAVVHAV